MNKVFTTIFFASSCIFAQGGIEKKQNNSVEIATDAAPIYKSIVLKDDQELMGEVVAETDSTLSLKLGSGGILNIDKSSIKETKTEKVSISSDGKQLWPSDPALSRYFYSPSALMSPKGTAHFSQKMLIFSSLGYTFTEHFSAQFSTSIPLLLASEENLGILSLKGAGRINSRFALGGGVQTWFIADNSFMLPYITTTIGSDDNNLSINYTFPFSIDGNDDAGAYLFSLAGKTRVGKNIALMGETFIAGINNESTDLIGLLGVRFMGKKLATDVGLLFIPNIDFPIPWLDFSFHW